MKYLILFCGLLFSVVSTAHESAPDRRIYILKSSGVCDGCAESISQMLISEGITSQILGPGQLKKFVRPQDVVVIGGGVPDAEGEWTIKEDLVKVDAFDWLKQHIANGGRYIGICAGAYLTEKWIDQSAGEPGLDIFPGVIDNYSRNKSTQLMLTHWNQQNVDRWVYFQDGPAMILNADAKVKVFATFSKTNRPAALSFAYGKGLVGLISPHLEANEDWFKTYNLRITKISHDLGNSFFRDIIQ